VRVAFQRPFSQEYFADRFAGPLEDPAKPAVVVAAATLASYAGEYELAPNFILTVRQVGDSLTAQGTGQGATNLIAESTTRFRVRQVKAEIEFKTDETGRVTGLVLFQNGQEMPGRRKN
jgi:hypothetical protein